MKGLTKISKKSEAINVMDKKTWLPLYYSPSKKEVYTSEGEGRFLLTYLINPNTPKEIEETVIRFMSL